MNRHARDRRWRAVLACFALGAVYTVGTPYTVVGQHVAATTGDADKERVSRELLARPVSVNVVKVSRRQAIDAIAKAAKVGVQYRVAVIDQYSDLISVKLDRVSLEEALERVLHGTRLQVQLQGRRFLMIVESQDGRAMDSIPAFGKVAGRVVDSVTGRALHGVTVAVAGTKIGTLTDGDGRFALTNVPAGARILTFKLLGYARTTQAGTVHDQRVIQTPWTVRVSMAPTVATLNEVVTTATGQQRRLEVGSDITVINADSIMAHAPVQNFTDLLETRVPGLTVLRTTGVPGDPSRIRLRGAGTINGSNAPIVIVDGVRVYFPDGNRSAAVPEGIQVLGVASGTEADFNTQVPRPSPLDQIDPNSIETIEVFKGPSASALYGSDAANGVIVVTTKKGRAGKTSWRAMGETGTSAISGKYPERNFAFAHRDLDPQSTLTCSRVDPRCVVDSVVQYQALNDSRVSPLTRGYNNGMSATVSGGVQAMTYALTGSMTGNTGLIELPKFVSEYYTALQGAPPPGWMRNPDKYEIQSIGGQIGIPLGTTATATFSHDMTHSRQQRSSLDLGTVASLVNQYVPSGDFSDPDALSDFSAGHIVRNFAQRLGAETDVARTSASMLWSVRPGIPFRATVGRDVSEGIDQYYEPAGLHYPIGSLPAFGSVSTGSYARARSLNTTTTANGNVTVPVTLPRNARVDLALGVNAVKQALDAMRVHTDTLLIGSDNPGNRTIPGEQTLVSSTTFGWFAEPQLRLPGRFFVTPGIRFDGGSSSGANAGLTLLPKINGSWIAWADENASTGGAFRRAVSLLRLRWAVGAAGVQPAPGAQRRLFASAPTSADGGHTLSQGYEVITLGNTKLRPERSTEVEGGFDADLFQRRLTIRATTYHQVRRDAIIGIEVAPSLGIAAPNSGLTPTNVNIGRIRKTGVELSGSLHVIDTRSAQWGIDGQFSRTTNRVLSLARGQAPINLGNGTRVVAGYPLFGVWAKPMVGFYDQNGDGIIARREVTLADAEHAVYVGSTDPTFESTINTNVGFWNNRVTVTTTVNYQHGLTQNTGSAGIAALNSAADAKGSTLLTKAIAVVSDLQVNGGGINGTQYYLYQRVNLLRWQGLSLNFRLPTRISRALRGEIATLALQGSNLALRSNYRGKDPNVNAFASGNNVGDFGQLPRPRTWNLRLSVVR